MLALTWGLASHTVIASTSHKKQAHSIDTSKTSHGASYATRPEALLLADEIASRRKLDPVWVRKAIRQARFLPQVVRLMAPATVGSTKNWELYRSRFIEPKRIQSGVKFWLEQRKALERAEIEFGVPAEIIVGVIGVETIYGQQLGTFKVLDALATLSFDFPKNHPRAKERSAFFRAELEELLSFQLQGSLNPLTLRGSYAGAMGMPQFMPSSWAKYALDFDGNGKIDLFSSPSDVIGSVANYLKSFNWTRGVATHYVLDLKAEPLDLAYLLAPDILPTFLPEDLTAKGVILEAQGLQHPGLLALVKLENGNAKPTYIAGTENFYAITRYNWSSYYALAVIELGQAVSESMKNR